MTKRNKYDADLINDLVGTFKQSNMISTVLAHFDNCRSYRKLGGNEESLRANEKYFSVELPYNDMSEKFLYWLYECKDFVYISVDDGILFGFSDRNDALMCKIRYMGKE